MDKEFILNFIKSVVPQLKAQVAEQLKVQGVENANVNVNLHIGDNNVTVNVPAGKNLTNLASTEITPEITNIIQKKTLEALGAQQRQPESLSERDFAEVVVSETLASVDAVYRPPSTK